MSGCLETVDLDRRTTDTLRLQGVLDRGAFVDHLHTCSLERRNERSGTSASRLHNLDTRLDDGIDGNRGRRLVRHLRNAFLALMAPELVVLPAERLDAEGFDRIVTWIDLNCAYYPSHQTYYGNNTTGRSPLSHADLAELGSGKATPQSLFQMGKLRVDGEVEPAHRLNFLKGLI